MTYDGVRLSDTMDYYFIHTLKVGIYKDKLVDISDTDIPNKLCGDDKYSSELAYINNDYTLYTISNLYSVFIYIRRNDKAFDNFYNKVMNGIK